MVRRPACQKQLLPSFPPGTIMSYAKDSHAKTESQRVTDFNHFVVFDPRVRGLYKYNCWSWLMI